MSWNNAQPSERSASAASASARARTTPGWWVVLLVVGWPAMGLCAQDVGASVDEGLRRQAERDRAQQASQVPKADVLRPAGSSLSPPDLPVEQPCFPITNFKLDGPDSDRLRWLLAATERYRGLCIGAAGLGLIAGHLDALLIEQGYVTSRVSLGPQTLQHGEVRFTLHAGRIAEIRFVDADSPEGGPDMRWGSWRNAFPTGHGRLLDSRDLEQGVEQMKRLPSQTVTTTLAPGEQPDTSVVTILRRVGPWRDRLRGGLTLDNAGGRPMGRTQLSVNTALDNPTGLNDVLSLGFNSNAESPGPSRRSMGSSISYSLPWGYNTFSLSLSRSRFAQRIRLTSAAPLSRGESRSAELRWQHTVWRTAASKTGLHAALSSRRAHSHLDDVELVTAQRRTTALETGLSWQLLFGQTGRVELELGYRRGMPWLRAQPDLIHLARDADGLPIPTLRPRIWLLNASAALPELQAGGAADSPRRWQLHTSMKAQFNRDYSTSIDQFAIGNRASVRGFDGDAVLMAESGWVWRNELTTPVQAWGRDFQAVAALDMGRVWGPSDASLPGHRLTGAALGVRARLSQWQFDFTLAKPLKRPEGFKTARTSAYASATYAF
ncbi:ShlB/FhaC/HecB family hemolysin secretion/activation protein [Aquincola tertiaricarbonis]|uniref:ShlB/FhaC/HecB family hemolysin secretion/activation protein n=1 Tax=Aquincola tertiaricarbonis TaxID=391953 RepID=UPI0009FB488C|nr:ShlB/FhaC/HecB family hemolysin secretion/activation protein [Aquincola tertiaricarbonis]